MKLMVWGTINGVAFRQVFNDVAEWKAERAWIEQALRVDVHGMQSTYDITCNCKAVQENSVIHAGGVHGKSSKHKQKDRFIL